MRHLLRAITGPHAGGTYVLGRRTTIGRASDCDVQILHEGVSRRHAKVTLQDDGSMLLVDLSSDNGTFVDDERIERHSMLPGQEVRVMRARYVYEQDHGDKAETSAVYGRKVTSGESLRQTADHGKALAAIRSGMARGMVGERARPHSRPQAAAPAPSGARPGAASPTGAAEGSGPAPRPLPSAERIDARRPIPARSAIPEPSPPRRPGVRAPSVVDELDPMEKRTRETPRPKRSGPATVGVPVTVPGQGDGDTVRLSTGTLPVDTARLSTGTPSADTARLSTGTPSADTARLGSGTLSDYAARLSTGSSSPDQAEAPLDRLGPGRARPRGGRATVSMAAAGGLDPLMSRDERAAASRPASSGTGAAGPDGPGRSRTAAAPRPTRPEAPRSMRPGTTSPPGGEDPSAPMVSVPDDEAPVSRHRTAEYGAMSPAEPPAADDPEALLDRMRTRPRVRRAKPAAPQAMRPGRSSSTPTEEVPVVADGDPDQERVDDEVYETRPRLTINPRSTRVPLQPPPLAAEPPAAPVTPGPPTEGSEDAPSRADLAYEDTVRATVGDEVAAVAASTAPGPGADQPFPTAQQMLEAFDRLDSQAPAPDPEPTPEAQPAGVEPGLVFEPRHGIECLVDILEYRQLRLLSLRGQAIGRERYVALEYQLHHRDMGDDDAAATRRYHRFPCSITAQLTHQTRKAVTTIEARVLDLSAGGARIEFGEYRIDTGEVVWLAFDLRDADLTGTSVPRAQTVLFKARVVWTQPHRAQLGVIFAGSPRYDQDVRVELEV